MRAQAPNVSFNKPTLVVNPYILSLHVLPAETIGVEVVQIPHLTSWMLADH